MERVRLDHDEEMVPIQGMYRAMEDEQRRLEHRNVTHVNNVNHVSDKLIHLIHVNHVNQRRHIGGSRACQSSAFLEERTYVARRTFYH